MAQDLSIAADYFRRPERIEMAISAIAAVTLTLAWFLGADATDSAALRYTLLAGCGVSTMCVIAGSLVTRRRYRATALILHFVLTIVIVFTLRDAGFRVVVLLLLVLELHVALRLPVPAAVVADGIALASVTALMLAVSNDIARLVEVILLGVTTALLAETTIMNRERVVQAEVRIAAQLRSLESLAAANRSFVAHLESVEAEAAERERLLITRELHDCVGYSMTNITMMMNAAQYLKEDDQEELLEYCQKTKALASTTLQETRQILYRLRSIASQVTPSPPLFFARLCRDFAEATGVRTECNLGNLPRAISESTFNTLFRAVQVGFINSLRHGNAGHIALSFWVTEKELVMSIWNDVADGVAVSPATEEGIGLRGVRERLDTLRGAVRYGPVANGWLLDVTMPREALRVEQH